MDEYDDLLARVRSGTSVPKAPALPVAPKLDEYDQLLAQVRTPDRTIAQAAVFNGSFSNPAIEAEKRNLSKNIKAMLGEDIAPSIIDPVEDKRRVRQAEMDHGVRQSEAMRKWIEAEPSNAGLIGSKDVQSLLTVDGALSAGKRALGNTAAGLFADPASAFYTTLAMPFKLGEQVAGTVLPDWMAQSEMGKALLWAAREAKKTGDVVAGPAPEGNIEAGVYSGFRSLGGNVGTMLLGGALNWGAKATTAAMSAVQGGVSALKAFDQGKDASTAFNYGAADMAAEYATELPGMKALLATPGLKQGINAFLKKTGEFALKEMGGEQVATVWQNFNEWMFLHPDKTWEDFKDEMPDAAIQTAIATIVGGGGQIAVQQMMVRGRQKETRAIFDALNDGAKNSDLLKAVPEKYREFVQKATEDGGIQNVFIPADKFVTYFQGVSLDPALVATELHATNYAEATHTGSDVMIPMEDFATMIAGTDHYAGLADDLRLHQGDMTARELQLEEANREESDKLLQQQIEQLIAEGEKAHGLNAAIDTITTDVEGQLIASGVERSAAKTQAQLMRGIAVMAERAFPGQDPVESAGKLWAKYGLTVNRDLPAILTHLKASNLEIDPLLDTLRGKGPQSDSEIFGQSLVEFLREHGGLAPVGELTDAGTYPTPAGKKKLISDIGKKLDEAAMAAVDAGYFPGTENGQATETQLVEAILNELGGSPTYSMNQTDEAAMGRKQSLEMLDKAIKAAGIDLNVVTDNAEVRHRLEMSGKVTGAMFQKVGAGGTADTGPDLIIQHNLSADNLLHAVKMGGIPVPSLAVTKKDHPLQSFGEITLLGSKEMADPKGYAGTKVFGADIYSPRYPSVTFKLDSKALKKLNATLAEYRKEGGREIYGGEITKIEDLTQTDAFRAYMLDKTGKTDIWDLRSGDLEAEASRMLADAGAEEKLFRGYDYNGNRRYQPHTLENVVKILKKELRGGENFNYGVGSIRAKFTPQFRSIDQIRKAKNRLMDKDAFERVKSEIDDEFHALMDGLSQYHSHGDEFGFGDMMTQMMYDAAGMGVSRALRENQFKEVPVEQQQEIAEFLTKLRNLPTEYFEAKILRDVDLAEFSGAVVPEGVNPKVIEALQARGIKDIRTYKKGDQVDRTAKIGEFENLFFQNYGEDTRGYLKISDDRKMQIGLTENADLSTFLHETGHFYLELLGDLAETDGVSQQIKDDYAAILKWMGVSSRAEITTAHHEQFARGNEAYLREGKAPTEALQGAFQRFKAWLTSIYTKLESLDVKLSNEVRDVFDRIYASDQEIQAAKGQVDVAPLFIDAATAGMSEAEFKNYVEGVGKVSGEARDKLMAKLMKEYQRGKQQWWKAELAKMSKEVAAEVDALPVYQAFAALTTGKLPDGTPIKLDRGDLHRRYGEDFTQKLPRTLQRVYAAEGMNIDTAAEILGYQSGDDLVKALNDMRPRKELIAAEAAKRMADLHGDMLLDGTIEQEAQAALHNDKRADILMTELRALRRRQIDVAPFVQAEKNKATAAKSATIHALDALPSLSAYRQAAAGRIDQTAVRDLNPTQYLIAGRKAAREAGEALARQDAEGAATAKHRELLNHYMFLEATKAQTEAKKIAEYAKSFDKASRRQSIAKAGKSYLEQIDALLDRFEFKNVTLRTVERRQSLADFIAEKEAEGETFAIPQNLIDEAGINNWRQASMMELRGLNDALRNLAHLANFKNKLLRKRAAIDFDLVKTDLLSALDGSFKDSTGELGKLNDKSNTVAEKAAALWRKFDAAHIKVEQLVEWMDGGKGNGPWARYFFDLADDAQVREYDLHAKVTKSLQDLTEGQSKEWRGSLMDKTAIRLPGVDGPLTRYDLISIALNAGNESNLQRLRDGRGWTQGQITAALNELTAEDIAFVNGIWNTLESLWPEISALQERVAGVAPPKVAHQKLAVKNGELAGGYYPLVYDPKVSAVGAKQADATASVQDFMARGYGKANTSTGHTKERVENFKAPLLLDFEQVLTSHMSKVIKDISHREAIIGLSKILQNPEIKSALIDKLGEARYKLLTTWEQTLISDRADTLHQPLELHNALFRGLRTHTAIVTMGWKISTMLSQFAGFGPSMDLVKPKYLTQALIDSKVHAKDTLAFVQEKSGEMRHRMDTIDRDMKDVLLKTRGEHGMLVAVQRSAFYLTALADRAVSVPTWLGGYRQALAEGLNEEDSIRAGDRAVRLSQGAGGAKDLAAVQRNSELMKLLTMYYTPFSVLYARLRDMGHTTHSPKDLPRLVARSLVLVILPAVLGELLAGRGPDDDEDKIMWAARKALLYPTTSMPVIRDLVNWQIEPALAKAGGGSLHFQPGYKLSPVVQAIEKVGSLPSKLIDGWTGERPWDDVAWDSLEASGYVFGLPTAQTRITGEYLSDLWTGKATPANAAEAMHDVLFRRPIERSTK